MPRCGAGLQKAGTGRLDREPYHKFAEGVVYPYAFGLMDLHLLPDEILYYARHEACLEMAEGIASYYSPIGSG